MSGHVIVLQTNTEAPGALKQNHQHLVNDFLRELKLIIYKLFPLNWVQQNTTISDSVDHGLVPKREIIITGIYGGFIYWYA